MLDSKGVRSLWYDYDLTTGKSNCEEIRGHYEVIHMISHMWGIDDITNVRSNYDEGMRSLWDHTTELVRKWWYRYDFTTVRWNCEVEMRKCEVMHVRSIICGFSQVWDFDDLTRISQLWGHTFRKWWCNVMKVMTTSFNTSHGLTIVRLYCEKVVMNLWCHTCEVSQMWDFDDLTMISQL